MFKYKKNKIDQIKKNLKLIKELEKIRAKNNKNWMDLYRVAFKYAPDLSVKITKRILNHDKKISEIVKKLH